MDIGILLVGIANSVAAGAGWLAKQEPAVLCSAGAAVGLLWAAGAFSRHRHRMRRLAARRAAAVLRDIRQFKETLRARLALPADALDGSVNGAPTLGASEAFEADLESAVRTMLTEASGHRAKAKSLLRERANGNGKPGTHLNGAHATYWRQLGALALLESNQDALVAYSRAADLAPDDAQVLMLLGILHLRGRNLAAAEAAFKRQVQLADGLPEGAALRYRGRTMLGDVCAARDAYEEALAFYRDAQREVLSLLEGAPDDKAYQRDLSVTCDRIGDALLAVGEEDAALESYRQGLAIVESLCDSDRDSPGRQHDLSVSHDRIGDVLEKKGDLQNALLSHRRGLAIAQRLAAEAPEDTNWQWDLSVSYERVGDVLYGLGKEEEAMKSYYRSLAIAEELATREPEHLGWQRDLAASYHKVGSLEAARHQPEEARDLLERGRAIIMRLVRIAALKAQWRADLAKFDNALQTLDG